MVVALIGNPNCGKSTLFNRMTSGHAHVGNWAGVTVERKQAALHGAEDIAMVDLPGIYSLTPYTGEERVTQQFLLAGQADRVVNLLDARSIERGLYLTLQLIEAGCAPVVAVGMLEELRRLGGGIDCACLARALGVSVLEVNAKRGNCVDALRGILCAPKPPSGKTVRYDQRMEDAAAQAVAVLQQARNDAAQWRERTQAEPPHIISLRFWALHLLEADGQEAREESPLLEAAGIRLRKAHRCAIAAIAARLCEQTGESAAAFIARERYRIVDSCLRQETYQPVSDRLAGWRADGLFLHRILALPIFAVVMGGMFAVCFGAPGLAGKQWMERLIAAAGEWLGALLEGMQVSEQLRGLICDGVIGGVGSVLCFLPQITLLFLCIGILEECGYLARAAFLSDLPMRGLGLTGQSFIPLLMGLGCSTPAVMAARTLPGEQNRATTVVLVPFISCGAKLPVYALFAQAFFPARQGLAVALCYLTGFAAAVCYGLFLKNSRTDRHPAPFLTELPAYRIPSLRSLWRNTAEKCVDFVKRAGTLIFLMSVLIWLLRHTDAYLHFTDASETSLFMLIGGWLAPVFAPLGFGNQQAAVALLAGGAAKEAIVSTLGVLCGAGGAVALTQGLHMLFTPLSAVSFLVFCTLYAPCVSALAAMRRELGSTMRMLRAAALQTAIAYGAALAVYQCGLVVLRLFH